MVNDLSEYLNNYIVTAENTYQQLEDILNKYGNMDKIGNGNRTCFIVNSTYRVSLEGYVRHYKRDEQNLKSWKQKNKEKKKRINLSLEIKLYEKFTVEFKSQLHDGKR